VLVLLVPAFFYFTFALNTPEKEEKMAREEPKEHMIEGKPYIYCKEHDIYFPKKFQEEADAQEKKMREAEMICPFVHACPMCQEDFIAPMRALAASIAAEHELDRTMPRIRTVPK
jgi:hypothetical protein